MDVLFSPTKYSSAIILKDPGVFGNKRQGSQFAVFSKRRRLESQGRKSEHVRLSTLIEINSVGERDKVLGNDAATLVSEYQAGSRAM